jgi:DNA polymerase-3 subunit alpha
MGDVNLPNYEIPAPFATPLEYFKHICKTGFDKRFQGRPEHEDPVYLERYDYEMSVIEKMGFETYFLIVWDFINYARSVSVYIGPGRGSAAGSLLAFCMGITDMDPIRFNLLFERFLNPERVSWPD